MSEDTKNIIVFHKERLKTNYDDLDLDDVIEELTVQSNLLQHLQDIKKDINAHVSNLVDKKIERLLRGDNSERE